MEEFIDENHAIVSTNLGPNYYVTVLSIVDKDLLDPGQSVLLHNKCKIYFNYFNNLSTFNCWCDVRASRSNA